MSEFADKNDVKFHCDDCGARFNIGHPEWFWNEEQWVHENEDGIGHVGFGVKEKSNEYR